MNSVLILIHLLGLALPHEFHISRCEIVYNSETQSLEVTHHLFADDVEKAIRSYLDEPIYLCTELETASADSLVEDYLSRHLVLSMSSKPVDMYFLGKEPGEDPTSMWVYIEAPEFSAQGKLRVELDVLCEVFSDQKNIVSFQVDNEKPEMFLLDDKTREVTIDLDR